MTDRTINLKEAADIVRHECGEWTGLAETIIRRFKELPTVDAVPVRRGKWERHFSRPNVYADLYWHCSACGGKKADAWADKYKFCPDCGARMDGKGNGNEAD